MRPSINRCRSIYKYMPPSINRWLLLWFSRKHPCYQKMKGTPRQLKVKSHIMYVIIIASTVHSLNMSYSISLHIPPGLSSPHPFAGSRMGNVPPPSWGLAGPDPDIAEIGKTEGVWGGIQDPNGQWWCGEGIPDPHVFEGSSSYAFIYRCMRIYF